VTWGTRRPPSPGAGDDDAARNGFVFTGVVLAAVLVITLAFQWTGDHLPGPLAGAEAGFESLVPQHWSFFAGVSHGDEYTVAALDPAGHRRGLTTPFMSEANGWGFGQAADRQIVELQRLVDPLPATAWIACTDEPDPCDADLSAGHAVPVANTTEPPSVCGDVVVTDVRPAPAGGSWRRVRIVVLDVRCPA
jgi:hypothetical protein